MKTWMKAPALALVACAMLAGSALAQNMSLRAPDWAQALLATDVTPTTGGRATLAAEGIELSVRVTIAPSQGGVARVARFDQHGDTGTLAVRRFTGHPATGWWLWGSDAPRITTPAPAIRAEIASLARAASGVAATLGNTDATASCASDEQAYIEIAVAGRSTSYTRACITGQDAASRLATRMSEIAGSRDEEEFHAAAQNELLEADRAFAAKAQADGVPAAFAAYASDDALMVSRQAITRGRDAVTARFANWPAGAHLQWAPEGGRVSDRGDMGWTWGNSTFTTAAGVRTTGRYISVWTRDLEGNWRYAFDAAID